MYLIVIVSYEDNTLTYITYLYNIKEWKSNFKVFRNADLVKGERPKSLECWETSL